MKPLNFFKDTRGVAAVEMALITPFIVGFALMSVNVWDVGMRKQDMRGALKLASQYYMNGGQADDDARSIALSSWQRKPANSTFTIARFCQCAAVAAACGTLCPDSTPPAVYVRMVANATSPNAMFSPVQTDQELVRVR